MKLPDYQDEQDTDRFWAEIKPRREPLRVRWFLPLVILILCLSVPWYQSGGQTGQLYWDIPTWIWVTLLCSFMLSCLTAWMALRFWDDDERDQDQESDTP